VPTLDRDLTFFLVFFPLGLALGFGAPSALQIPAGAAFLAAYPAYVWLTLAQVRSSRRRPSIP